MSPPIKLINYLSSPFPNSIIAQNNLIRPDNDNAEDQVQECLYNLINVKILKLLHILSQWSHQWKQMKKHQNQENSKEIHRRKRSKKANEDVVTQVNCLLSSAVCLLYLYICKQNILFFRSCPGKLKNGPQVYQNPGLRLVWIF